MTNTIKSISLNEEGLEALKSMQKDNLDFNFSNWVNNKLKESENTNIYFDNEISIINKIETCKNNIKRLHSEIAIQFSNIEDLLNKKSELEIINENKKQEEAQRKQKEIEKVAYKRKMINSFFREETGRELTEEEFLEYNDGLENDFFINIYDFIEKKGLKTKKEDEEVSS